MSYRKRKRRSSRSSHRSKADTKLLAALFTSAFTVCIHLFIILPFRALSAIVKAIVYESSNHVNSSPSQSQDKPVHVKNSASGSKVQSSSPVHFMPSLQSVWDEWDESVHHKKGQYTRFHKALCDEITIVNRRYPATVQGSTGTLYCTSLSTCSCPDFEKRGLPCKHIYRLALDRGIISKTFLMVPVLPKEAFDQSDPPDAPYKNYIKRTVRGRHEASGKRSQHVIYMRNLSHLEEEARKLGLSPPYKIVENGEVTYIPKIEDLSEAQVKILRDFELHAPDEALAYETHDIIDRVFQHNNLESPDLEIAQYADHMGCSFSLYVGENEMKHIVENFWKSNLKEASAFYVYSVYRILYSRPLADFSQLSNRDWFCNVSDNMTNQMLQYIHRQNYDGIMNPSSRSNAYKYSVTQIQNNYGGIFNRNTVHKIEDGDTFVKKPFRDEYGNRIS